VAITLGVGMLQTIFRLRRQVDAALELGQYTLGRKLGEGGMGVVYEAEHRLLARPAAIKLIRADSSSHDEKARAKHSTMLSRFEAEARATARLQSPHTIGIYDYGRTDRGEFYYVMELLNGIDFESLVVRFGPVDPARTVVLLRQACHSLAEAHTAGMVHRDIKPANLYTCRLGQEYDFVKVLDFGLVKEHRHEESGQTLEGSMVGTPAYMAPEMVMAKPDIDGRADLYALGCVAYWMLCGQMVFEGRSAMGLAAKHVSEEPPPLSERAKTEIPPALERIVMMCLNKKKEDRPDDASTLDRLLRDTGLESGWDEDRAKRWWEQHLAPSEPSAPSTPPAGGGGLLTVILD
jgi:serine/threonine-protein kinase